jgi:hypothetical protein
VDFVNGSDLPSVYSSGIGKVLARYEGVFLRRLKWQFGGPKLVRKAGEQQNRAGKAT